VVGVVAVDVVTKNVAAESFQCNSPVHPRRKTPTLTT
jgi:hypothetical protein